MLKLNADVCNYEPWYGAVHTYSELQSRGLLDTFFDELELCYPEGIDMTDLNDLLRFEPEFCYKLVGLVYDSENDEILD